MKTTRRDPHEKAPRGPSRPKLVSVEDGRRILNDLHKPVKTSKPPKAV